MQKDLTPTTPAPCVILMGVSGSGKTTVGEALAARLGYPFYDGDDFHPPENVAKMARGTPLDDDDRASWLAAIRDLLARHSAKGETAVVACSALKHKYRDQLRPAGARLLFVYLHADFAAIETRMEERQGHYMKAGMLGSQFEALEEPGRDEALWLNALAPVEELVERILLWSQAGRGG